MAALPVRFGRTALRVVFFLMLATLLTMPGAAVAGPAEDFRDAKAARSRDDYATALRLYRRAAEQGHVDAQLELGYIYFKGQMRLPVDDVESAKWYLRAAELGNAMAQRNIGMAYRFGQGVPKDPVMGLMWLNLAVAQGYKRAVEDRDGLASEMPPAQVTEAQKLTDAWKPKR
jgi:TPR repeat protein